MGDEKERRGEEIIKGGQTETEGQGRKEENNKGEISCFAFLFSL